MSGELVKLKITAFSDPRFSRRVAGGEFKTMLNPEKYAFTYQIEQNEDQAPGTSAAAPRFNRALPEDLELEFIFDRTGVVTDYGGTGTADDKTWKDRGRGVIDDVEHFKKVVFDYNGEEHRPNYLMISWGTLLFKGTLSKMDLTFKLFKPDGTPLRAVAKATFKGFVEDNLREAMEKNSSPDLTHVREVMKGDTLPLMAYRIYGDSKYYLEVAKVNHITNFRKLETGRKIVFPPLQKRN
jgi:nucleoid-associated protein YgaU